MNNMKTDLKNKMRVLSGKVNDFLFDAANVDFAEIVCWFVGHKLEREVVCSFPSCPCLDGAVKCVRCGSCFRDGKEVTPGMTRIF